MFQSKEPINFSPAGNFTLGTNLAQELNYTYGCLFNQSVLTGEGSRKAPFFFSSLGAIFGVIFGVILGAIFGVILGVIVGAIFGVILAAIQSTSAQ
jgi:hypothetical protein